MEDSTDNEKDETRRRFQEILAAKRSGNQGGGTSVPGRQDKATRQSPAKGGRNYRRKV